MADEQIVNQGEEQEEESSSVKKEKQRILKRMQKLDPCSEEYAKLSKRLTEITECQKNMFSGLGGFIIQGATNLLGTVISFGMNRKTVNDMLKYEDSGNIVTTKATGFVKKP